MTIGASNRSVVNCCCAWTLYVPHPKVPAKPRQISPNVLLNETSFRFIPMSSIKTVRVAEKCHADTNIPNKMTDHGSQTVVGVEPIDVRSRG